MAFAEYGREARAFRLRMPAPSVSARGSRWPVRLAVALSLPLMAAAVVRWRGLLYGAPHQLRAPSAQLSRELALRVDERAAREPAADIDAAIAQALRVTGSTLHFGLGHPTSLSFSEEREGNCVEYAHLFATVFGRVARKAGLDAHAHVVHTMRPRLFGLRVPFRGFDDHDWVLVTDGKGQPLAYLDPTLHDAMLGADVSGNVEAPVIGARR